jgi:DNA-binding MarR family transcriptional regulator
VRQEIFAQVQDAGHPGFTRATFPLWRFEGLDGRQPSDIVLTSGLSKQAVNDQLGALERLGYLERIPHPSDGRGRIVRLTERGRDLDRAVRVAAQQVEEEWTRQIGEPAWQDFRTVLDRIAARRRPW